MNDFTLHKSRWESDGDNIRFSVPLTKVDKQNRLVSGWATLDNVDTQGDIVTAEASAKAFSRARGNLREMHQPIAVGKIVSFQEEEFVQEDPVTGEVKFYRGIFVTARVSEGAEDTWKKVLDETLTGFSIGGSIIDASNEMSKDGSGTQVRIVKDYDLVELSLVDNPANQLANIFSFTKTASGSVNVEGMIADTKIENVFMCKKDGNIKSVGDTSADCPECGTGMENIGWFESGKDRAEKVREVINKFKSPNTIQAGNVTMTEDSLTVTDGMIKSATGGEDKMTEQIKEEQDVDVNDTASTEVEETPSELEEVSEETEEVEEVQDEEEAISKKIDELKEVVTETLEKNRSETNEAVEGLSERIEEISSKFAKTASELEELKSKFTKFDESLTAEKNRLAGLEKKLDAINSNGAVKKSADFEKPAETTKKTTWDGAFSIDNLR